MTRLSACLMPFVAAAALALLPGCDRFTSVETRLTRAAASLESGEFQAALIDLRKALDAEPGNLNAQLQLVDTLAAFGETQAARAQLDRAVQAGAPASQTELRRLRLLRAWGDREGMKRALEQSTTLSAAQRETFQGQLSLLEGQPADALAAFDRALAADASSIDAALGRIEALAGQGDARAAREAVDALLEQQPSNGRAWLFKGSLAAHAGDFDAATTAYDKAIEYSGGMSREQRLQTEIERIETLLASGKLETARSGFARLAASAAGSPIVSLLKARIALADKDATTAVNELRQFTQAAPQHLPGRLLLTAALQEQGSTEQAFAEAVRMVAEFPNNDEARLALAGVQLRLGRSSDAESTLQPLIAHSPPNPLAGVLLGEIRMRSGDVAAGVSLLEQSLTEHPDDGQLKLRVATAQIAAGNARRAMQILETIDDSNLATTRARLNVFATAALRGAGAVEGELDAAIERYPQDVDLMVMAAAYAANTGNVDLGRQRLQKALQLQPSNAMLLTTLAKLELSVGRLQEAEVAAKSALEQAPNDPGGMVLMASIAGQRGQDGEVDAWLNRARVANPGALDVSFALARRAVLRGNQDEARRVLADAARNAPNNPGARVALAELIASQGQLPAALTELREVARQYPDSPLVQLTMAKVQVAAKDPNAARASLRTALKLEPGWLPAATMLAGLEVSSGNLSTALGVVQEVRRAFPDGNTASLLEGEVYLAGKRPVQAAAAFSAAYRIKPGSTASIRALQAKLQAKITSPESELRDWLAKSPGDSAARRILADFYMSTRRNDAAVEQFEQVVAARPSDGIALNNLAWLYQQAGDARALVTAAKAYAAAPKVAAVADTYGWILVESNRLADGLRVLAEAAQLAPEDDGIQYHYAEVLAKSGQKQKAIDILETSLGRRHVFESRAAAERLLRDLKL